MAIRNSKLSSQVMKNGLAHISLAIPVTPPLPHLPHAMPPNQESMCWSLKWEGATNKNTAFQFQPYAYADGEGKSEVSSRRLTCRGNYLGYKPEPVAIRVNVCISIENNYVPWQKTDV